jgi:hypothetical protein
MERPKWGILARKRREMAVIPKKRLMEVLARNVWGTR